MLPVHLEGRPVAARFETQEDFVPGPWVRIVPTEDIILYFEDAVYDPHKKVWHVELSFLPEESDGKVDSAELAQFVLDLEALVRLGWMPLMVDELPSVENENPVSVSTVH
jgi:hypothetical protein